MSSTAVASATSTLSTAIPSGSVSALIGDPPVTETDYWIAKYLLLAFHKDTDPLLGVTILSRPDPYHYETKGPSILISMSIAIGVMILITGARLGVRLFRRGLMVGLDDAFIVPGVLLAIAWPTLQIVAVIRGGAGKHIYDLTYEEYSVFKTCTNLSKLMFFLSVGFIKVSICLFNRRLTSLSGRAWVIFNNTFLALLTMYILAALFMNIFQCNPAYGGWDPIRIAKEGKAAVCQSDNLFGSSLSVIHVIMDFGLLAVPVIVLWKVRMNLGTKLRLYFVFAIGGMSAIGSIIRQIEQGRISIDVTYSFVHLQNWTLVDLSFGVVAASLPVLSAFIPKTWKSVTGSGRTPAYGYAKDATQRSAYIRSTGRNSITGHHSRTDSEENIMRTDEVELTYQKRQISHVVEEKKADADSMSSPSANSFGSDLGHKPSTGRKKFKNVGMRNDLQFGQDGIISQSSHQAWVGTAK